MWSRYNYYPPIGSAVIIYGVDPVGLLWSGYLGRSYAMAA